MEHIESRMSLPRILLISATPPSPRGVGGLYLLDCCRSYPAEQLACLHFSSAHEQKPWTPELSAVSHEVHPWPHDLARRKFGGKLGSLSAYADQQFTRRVRDKNAVQQALKFARTFKPDLIWTVLETPLMYRLPRQIATTLRLPLVTTVWDPPETVCGGLGWDRWSIQFAEQDFAASMRQSLRSSVVSENMQTEYARRFGTPTVLMRHAVCRAQCVTDLSEPGRETAFRIGFCGSIYSKVEWDALMAALDSVHWRLDGREVEVWVFGQRLLLTASGRSNVRFFGWRDTEELLPMLAQVDVAYLPYWFDLGHRESVRLCFPTKLGTYLACGLPVLFHGPAEASVATFFNKYPVGITCDSNETQNILTCLRRLSTDAAMRKIMQTARDEVLNTVLHLDLFLHRFREFVSIENESINLKAQNTTSVPNRAASNTTTRI